jgi:predicted nucleotidyltransferase
MTSDPFDKFAHDIESDPLRVLQARSRRSTVIRALKSRPDVVEVIPSGSLARGTHLGPIHDVDVIVVFDQSAHPDWRGSGSAQAALEYTQAAIRETLQAGLGRPLGLVHGAELRNHVVKCDLSPSLGPLDAIIPDPPPVDVMPAIREGSHLRVPECLSDRWIDVDPERLMRMVAARERAWSNFDEVVRMIKDWADHHELKMKSLPIEVMVLEYLPKPGLFGTMSCSDAVARFFDAASRAHITRLVDPAGRSGEIDPHMNYAKLRKALDESADLARQAVDAERAWQNRHLAQEGVTHPSVFWQKIFGKDRFKRPRVWYWYPRSPAGQPSPASRRWFDERAEPADESGWSWRPWRNGPSEPHSPGRTAEPSGPRPHAPAEAAGAIPDGPASLDEVLSSIAQDVPATPSTFG